MAAEAAAIEAAAALSAQAEGTLVRLPERGDKQRTSAPRGDNERASAPTVDASGRLLAHLVRVRVG